MGMPFPHTYELAVKAANSPETKGSRDMDLWIETIAGSLVKADSVTHVVVRENPAEKTWDVSVSASAAPALFASAATEAEAKEIRNSLVIELAAGNPGAGARIVQFSAEGQSVSAYGLAA
jgi:hypothetical protein